MGGRTERAAKILDRAVRQTYKEEGNKVGINTYQDVEPHMEYAAALRRADAENRGHFGKRPDFHHTMSIPTNVLYAAADRLGIPRGRLFDSENMKRIMKELKREEFKAFRTTTDKLI